MSYPSQRSWGSSPFGGGLTPLGKNLLILYVAIYGLELLGFYWTGLGPLLEDLFLFPLGPRFHVWQIVTHPFLQDPRDVFGVAMNLLMFYFFAEGLERRIGSRRFLFFFYFTAVGGAILSLPFLGLFGSGFVGMGASIAALVVAFGLMNPHSTILFNFFIPIRGLTLVYITVGIEAFRLLGRSPGAAVHLGAILLAYLYMKRKLDFLDPWTWKIHYDYWRLERMKRKLRVVKGGKGKANGGNGEGETGAVIH